MVNVKGQQRQLEMNLLLGTHGGWRPGAGRKRDRMRRDPDHVTRPLHRGWQPLHCTLRTVENAPRLRSAGVAEAIRAAMARVAGRREGFRIVHISLQHNHIHFLIEAADSLARTRGMQSVAIAIAKGINRALRRRGKLFAFRYHAVPLTTPRQVRNTIAYVLGNWRHHREHEQCAAARRAMFDPYATASRFDGWARPFDGSGHVAFPTHNPTLWLLTIGWRSHGPIDPFAVPG